MRIILLITLAVLWLAAPAFCDTIYLTNGNSIKGIIKSEDAQGIELEIDIGTVKFRKEEIKSVERSDPNDYPAMRQRWELSRRQGEEQRKAMVQAEAARREAEPQKPMVKVDGQTGHMVAKAILNGGITANLIVDTGATFVVLSKSVGDKLISKGAKLDPSRKVSMTVADGRKVETDFMILDRVQIEDSFAEHVEAAVMREDAPSDMYDGVLGMSFLSRFNFGFNTKEGKLTLQKLH